jgi:putative ABC transport system permease protein
VVLGVMLLFGMSSLLPTILTAFRQGALATAGQVDITVTNVTGASFDAEAADRLERVTGIGAVSPVLRRQVSMREAPVSAVTVVGVDPTSAGKVRTFPAEEGRMIAPSDRGDVAIGVGAAEQMGVGLGSTVEIPGVNGAQSFRVVGLLKTVANPGAPEVFMTLPDAQDLLGESGRVSEIEASLANGADRAAVEARARRALGEDYVVGGIQTGTELLASLQTSNIIVSIFGVFALAMGGFIILNTFRTVVAERRHDIGMLRAVGASRRVVLSIFLVESLIQGILGTALGLVLGYGFAWLIVAGIGGLYAEILNIQIGGPEFATGSLVLAITLGIGVSVVSALAPAISATRITPLEALRPAVGEIDERRRGVRAWIGVGVIVLSIAVLFARQPSAAMLASIGVLVGLVLVAPELVAPISNLFGRLIDVLFRTEGSIARSNMQRQPSRAATTAAAIMISLAIIIAALGVLASVFAGFLGYLDKSTSGADYVMIPANLILTQGNVGASEDFINAVEDVPGVTTVATMRVARGEVDDVPAQFIGIDPVDYPKVASFEFSEGDDADIARLGDGRYLIANGVFAAQNGVTTGQKVRVTTANGVKTYEFVAVGNDYLNAKLSTVYTSQQNLTDDFGVESNVAVLADSSTPGGTPAIQRDLDRLVADYPQMALYNTNEFIQIQEDLFAQYMVLFYVLIAMLAIPSLLALLNNLAMSVIARTREIGMLRAVGSTRKQVRRMVLAESLLLASVGVVFGVVGGVILGYGLVEAMNSVGFDSPYLFPTGAVVAAVLIGFGFALLAALLPARNASKLDIVTALHYE